MNIHLAYSLTVDDYHERRRAYRHTKRAWRKFSILMWAIILGFAIIIFVNFYQKSRWPAAEHPAGAPRVSGADLATLFALPLVCFIIWVVTYVSLRSKSVSRREFKSNPKLGDPLAVELTDAHITMYMQGSTVTQDWPQFKAFQETATLFLIFFGPEHALILPKRAFPSPAALDEFHAFAQAHIGNTPIGFSVQSPTSPTQSKIEN